MAESREDTHLHWFSPDPRGIIELDNFHIPKKLAKLYRKNPFNIKLSHNFNRVIRACAAVDRSKDGRADSWINEQIIELYCQLWQMGFGHSVECYDKENNELVGGLYGVAIGGAFFGESMFSRQANASKIALCYLVEHLRMKGFALLDTQYVNEHLKRFGAIEIPKDKYIKRLRLAIITDCAFL